MILTRFANSLFDKCKSSTMFPIGFESNFYTKILNQTYTFLRCLVKVINIVTLMEVDGILGSARSSEINKQKVANVIRT